MVLTDGSGGPPPGSADILLDTHFGEQLIRDTRDTKCSHGHPVCAAGSLWLLPMVDDTWTYHGAQGTLGAGDSNFFPLTHKHKK